MLLKNQGHFLRNAISINHPYSKENLSTMSKRDINEWDTKEIQEFNRSVITEFRENNGVVGGPFTNVPLLLLTTIGRKTGLERVIPLAYLADGKRYIIVASFAGHPANPPWYHNLVANPRVAVEVGSERFMAQSTVLDEPERSKMFDKVAALMPQFNDYQRKTSRVIPVVALTPVQ